MEQHTGSTKRRARTISEDTVARKRKRTTHDQIRVILKLFVVMGVTWLSEFLTFLFSWIFGADVVWKYFVVNDILNFSQGIVIFFVLVCKKSTFLRLKERFSRRRNLNGNANNNNNNNDRDQYRSTIANAATFVQANNRSSVCFHQQVVEEDEDEPEVGADMGQKEAEVENEEGEGDEEEVEGQKVGTKAADFVLSAGATTNISIIICEDKNISAVAARKAFNASAKKQQQQQQQKSDHHHLSQESTELDTVVANEKGGKKVF